LLYVCLCIPSDFFYAVSVMSEESRRLVLLRTCFCFFILSSFLPPYFPSFSLSFFYRSLFSYLFHPFLHVHHFFCCCCSVYASFFYLLFFPVVLSCVYFADGRVYFFLICDRNVPTHVNYKKHSTEQNYKQKRVNMQADYFQLNSRSLLPVYTFSSIQFELPLY
jgi:hypothetical protein